MGFIKFAESTPEAVPQPHGGDPDARYDSAKVGSAMAVFVAMEDLAGSWEFED